VVHNIAKDCNAFLLRVKQSWNALKIIQNMRFFHEIMQHHFAEMQNPNGMCFETDFSSVRGVLKVLVDVTVKPWYFVVYQNLTFCIDLHLHIRQLLLHSLQCSGGSTYRKFLTFKNAVMTFVIIGINAEGPNID
jgi:hypothetical protein